MKVALIGYGEVGRILAEDLVPRGHAVTAQDVKLGGEAGNAMREHAAKTTVMLAGSHAAAAQGAELVVVAVAQAAAPALDKGAFFLDFNSASPGAKIRAAAIVNAAAVFGTKGTKEFARSTDWRVEADRI
jgi:3-hydroxyisobutyrate dehydrogenase-like beta-hydroxyacid dehydrogenase